MYGIQSPFHLVISRNNKNFNKNSIAIIGGDQTMKPQNNNRLLADMTNTPAKSQ
jgi:hypothetical protein